MKKDEKPEAIVLSPNDWVPNNSLPVVFYRGVILGKPAYHTAQWGRATLEATLAVMESTEMGI